MSPFGTLKVFKQVEKYIFFKWWNVTEYKYIKYKQYILLKR